MTEQGLQDVQRRRLQAIPVVDSRTGGDPPLAAEKLEKPRRWGMTSKALEIIAIGSPVGERLRAI